MFSSLRLLVMCAVLAAFLHHTQAWWLDTWWYGYRKAALPGNRCEIIEDRRSCDSCGYPIDVTIMVKNELTDSPFKLEETIQQEPQQTLIRFLEKAVEQGNSFHNFTATYYQNLGYSIESINGLSGNSSTYWKISSLPSKADLLCGVTTYVPEHGEILLFDLTPINVTYHS
ncbi:uncharacterized protein LOC101856929 [Aplysia californica]|uniref:Uncharacterized protein LOC101856929 n=1 Tax=Aplysia californica TaxID=6500 RepID=A0ABM1AAH0_APLCA|nr:uncharacterized protein LOC101856929 [Aplysia californica]